MTATRRQFLKTIVVAAGTVALAPSALAAGTGFVRSRAFPQGVASGDPTPDSVVLWTRVVDPLAFDVDIPVRLQVASSRGFGPGTLIVDAMFPALHANAHCLRIKVTGLAARRRYFYRFLTQDGGDQSLIGRTKTAPRPNDEVTVRFAFASCQDFIGRYYNSYLPLLTDDNDDLDFLVHLGDFIYETTGDPSFQSGGGTRSIRFDDEAGAIPLGDPADPFFAARSLRNYRQLHRQYRNDRVLQQVLAKFPLIAIWDDHEFSDDSWRTNGTFFDARVSERDPQRKRDAERAWLEFIPIDDTDVAGAPADIIDTAPDRLFPNIRIWRGLRFGRTLNLTLTDYRSYRADHLIPEDAFPGTIVADAAQLAVLYAEIGRDLALDAGELHPYLAWSSLSPVEQGTLLAILTQAYAGAGFVGDPAARAAQALTGNLSVPILNRFLAAAGLGPITRSDGSGLSYAMCGKIALFSDLGARYAVVQKWFDVLARLRGLGAQVAWGDPQSRQVTDSLQDGADAHWNVLANSTSNTAMIVDLAQDLAAWPGFAQLSPALQQLLTLLKNSPLGTRITLNVDQWDGFPQRRERLLRRYRELGNVVMIAGDIHSSWVTDHSAGGRPLFELTGPAISSSSFGRLIIDAIGATALQLGAPPTLIGQLPALLPELIGALEDFLFDRAPESVITPLDQEIAFIDLDSNGIVVVEASAAEMLATYWLLPADKVAVRAYDRAQSLLAQPRPR
jgi:alkaline phosphatase D